MSVIRQSRGKEPLPNWIFATRLIWRRRELRRSSTDGKLLGFKAFIRTAFCVAVARKLRRRPRLPSGDIGNRRRLQRR
jgi:hypothetical protein